MYSYFNSTIFTNFAQLTTHTMKIRTLFLALLLIAGCACSTQPQWHLVWEENFDGSEIDGSVWTRIPRGSSDWNDMMSLREDLAFIKKGQLVLLGKAGAGGRSLLSARG